MILTFTVLLMLASPTPAQAPGPLQCSSFCQQQDGYQICFYEEKLRCGRREFSCVDSDTVECKPRFVSLGAWNPIPTDYKPQSYGSYSTVTTHIPDSYKMQGDIP